MSLTDSIDLFGLADLALRVEHETNSVIRRNNMALTVATNTGALMAQAAASSVNKEMEQSMERLSTGKRINAAADDAAGVAIASRLSSEIRGTNQAIRNAMDGQALLDTAEGAHIEIESILQRMREVAVQSRNDTNDADDRANLQLEVNALTAEINRIADTTSWAGKKLLTGSGNTGATNTGTFQFQVGSDSVTNNSSVTIDAAIGSMTAAALGVGAGNASVGANGATLSTVGGNVLQVGGTPAKGDVYNFSVNGDSVSFEITADSGTNFTFSNIKINGSAVAAASTAGTVDLTDDITGIGALGNDKHAVAKMAAKILTAMADGSDGGTQAGLTATAASDGTVTLIQKAVITAAAFNDNGSSTAATYTDSTNTIQFASIGADGAYTAAQDNLAFTINGVTFDISTQEATFNTTTGAGLVAAINAEIAAHKDSLKGITNLAAADTGNTIDITFTPAVSLTSVSATAGQTTTAVDVTSTSGIDAAIVAIDAAIKKTNNQRASLGSISNRLDNTVSNLTNISSNLQAGRGRIEDADFAAETTNLARTQILQQASTAMLAQANASKQNVLSLLQG